MERISTIISLKSKVRNLRNNIRDNSSNNKNKKTHITVWINGQQEIHSFGSDVSYIYIFILLGNCSPFKRDWF